MENNLFNFEICLIHAQLPYYLNRPFEAMDRHVELTSVLKGGNEGHLKYVYVSLSQILEPSLAIAALKRVEVVVESDDYYYLHSLVGRIYLNTGDVKNAQQHFQLCTGGSSLTCTSLDLANKYYLYKVILGHYFKCAWVNLMKLRYYGEIYQQRQGYMNK
ncbi:hypothetical protein O9G_005057 [Rozella allomycis CSF55]|uniref:Uncharacterized protein n=1 Tax=Rozella allomycis (strain CSF55) TaxID=988480 RepID=A0A075ARK2_ROZAC|nr:hypothetical protein O9G_005057 [Rozella allomycis CSF55]|eukprot:EPZ32873.1 hypothetical protein O9G_005057 [Rozella allomycis CSF55]